jgi:hypothetical protein
MDGKSLVPHLIPSGATDPSLTASTAAHLRSLPQLPEYATSWRKAVLLEYYYNDFNTKCVTGDPCLPTVGYPERDTWCGDLDANTHCWALYNCNTSCYDTETPKVYICPCRHASIPPMCAPSPLLCCLVDRITTSGYARSTPLAASISFMWNIRLVTWIRQPLSSIKSIILSSMICVVTHGNRRIL